jgi:hypothetical protein
MSNFVETRCGDGIAMKILHDIEDHPPLGQVCCGIFKEIVQKNLRWVQTKHNQFQSGNYVIEF